MKPLLKWAGGKRFLTRQLRQLIAEVDIERYFEPFAGGAALFFELEHRRSFLSDTNAELVNFYQVVKDDPDRLIDKVRRLQASEDEYYRVRESRPRTPETRAARFYYLVRLSFNGIYRENLSGQFNVPFGYKTNLEPLDRETLRRGSSVLQGATLQCHTFADAAAPAKRRDLIYFDPPYTVRHNNNGFIKYNARLFQWNDQVRLAQIANELVKRGCYVIVSNADHRDVSALYSDFQRVMVTRFSRISAQNHGRMQTTESLFLSTNIPLGARTLECN